MYVFNTVRQSGMRWFVQSLKDKAEKCMFQDQIF